MRTSQNIGLLPRALALEYVSEGMAGPALTISAFSHHRLSSWPKTLGPSRCAENWVHRLHRSGEAHHEMVGGGVVRMKKEESIKKYLSKDAIE